MYCDSCKQPCDVQPIPDTTDADSDPLSDCHDAPVYQSRFIAPGDTVANAILMRRYRLSDYVAMQAGSLDS